MAHSDSSTSSVTSSLTASHDKTQKRFDFVKRLSEKMGRDSFDCYKYQQFAAFQVTSYENWMEKIEPTILEFFWWGRKGDGGFQDVLWLLRTCDHHLKDFADSPEVKAVFPGRRMATKKRAVYAYFIRIFPKLYADAKKVCKEAKQMEKACLGVDSEYERLEPHLLAEAGDVDALLKLFRRVGLFLCKYKDAAGRSVADCALDGLLKENLSFLSGIVVHGLEESLLDYLADQTRQKARCSAEGFKRKLDREYNDWLPGDEDTPSHWPPIYDHLADYREHRRSTDGTSPWSGYEHVVNAGNAHQFGLNDYIFDKYGGMMGFDQWFMN